MFLLKLYYNSPQTPILMIKAPVLQGWRRMEWGIEDVLLRAQGSLSFVVLYCNFTSLAFLGLLGFLIRQLKIQFIATLLRAAK